jgi:hypothetical protein
MHFSRCAFEFRFDTANTRDAPLATCTGVLITTVDTLSSRAALFDRQRQASHTKCENLCNGAQLLRVAAASEERAAVAGSVRVRVAEGRVTVW